MSLGHPSCRDGGQLVRSNTHGVVYPPLLLQEQLVFTVVIVQALVQEREMLLPSSMGEDTRAGEGWPQTLTPAPLHPCIFFLPQTRSFPAETPLAGWLQALASCNLTRCIPETTNEGQRRALTSYLSDRSFSLWGISLGYCRGSSVSCRT